MVSSHDCDFQQIIAQGQRRSSLPPSGRVLKRSRPDLRRGVSQCCLVHWLNGFVNCKCPTNRTLKSRSNTSWRTSAPLLKLLQQSGLTNERSKSLLEAALLVGSGLSLTVAPLAKQQHALFRTSLKGASVVSQSGNT